MLEIARYSVTEEIPLFGNSRRTLSPDGTSFAYHSRFDVELRSGLVVPFAADMSVWAGRLSPEEAAESWQKLTIVSYAQWLHDYLGEKHVTHRHYSDREPGQKPYTVNPELQRILDNLGIVIKDGETIYTGKEVEYGKSDDGGFQAEVTMDYIRLVRLLRMKFVPVAIV
jgi:hypothetical protein